MRSSSKPVSILLVFLLAACSSPATTQHEEAALNAAEQWLALTDGGDHAGSWEIAAPAFQMGIRKEAWVSGQTTYYQQFGIPEGRELIAAKYTASLPRTEPGEYVLIQYRRAVKSGGAIVELLTMKRAGDVWQPAGYHFRRWEQ